MTHAEGDTFLPRRQPASRVPPTTADARRVSANRRTPAPRRRDRRKRAHPRRRSGRHATDLCRREPRRAGTGRSGGSTRDGLNLFSPAICPSCSPSRSSGSHRDTRCARALNRWRDILKAAVRSQPRTKDRWRSPSTSRPRTAHPLIRRGSRLSRRWRPSGDARASTQVGDLLKRTKRGASEHPSVGVARYRVGFRNSVRPRLPFRPSTDRASYRMPLPLRPSADQAFAYLAYRIPPASRRADLDPTIRRSRACAFAPARCSDRRAPQSAIREHEAVR